MIKSRARNGAQTAQHSERNKKDGINFIRRAAATAAAFIIMAGYKSCNNTQQEPGRKSRAERADKHKHTKQKQAQGSRRDSRCAHPQLINNDTNTIKRG
jgi:hypothetical protein